MKIVIIYLLLVIAILYFFHSAHRKWWKIIDVLPLIWIMSLQVTSDWYRYIFTTDIKMRSLKKWLDFNYKEKYSLFMKKVIRITFP